MEGEKGRRWVREGMISGELRGQEVPMLGCLPKNGVLT